MTYSFAVEGRPKAKGRPRLGRGGRTYTPQATIDAERRIANHYGGPLFDGPLRVEIEYHTDHQVITITPADWPAPKGLVRTDIDNLAKLTLDALNGLAWQDDKQVVELVARKGGTPRVLGQDSLFDAPPSPPGLDGPT